MLHRFVIIPALLMLVAAPSHAQLPGAPKPVTGSLLDEPAGSKLDGQWSVQMLHGNEDEPHMEALVITSSSAIALQGGFLGAPFTQSAMRQVDGETVFYAQTNDGTGPVYHSGRVRGGIITGQSYFTSSKELLPWAGQRMTDDG